MHTSEVREKFALARAFAASFLFYTADAAPRPFSASFAVTNRCNLRCSYCVYPSLDPSQLDLPRIERMFERLHSLGVRRLGLLGGEPLVRRDIGEIVALAAGQGLFVTMNTNLMLYRRYEKALAPVRLFFTSLDGDREAHVRNRGEGSHDGVLEAIREITSDGRKVVAICVVTEQNIDDAAAVLDDAHRIGFQVHFQPRCIDPSKSPDGEPSTVPDDVWRRFWEKLAELKRAGEPISSSALYLRHMAEWDDRSRTARFDPAVRCSAGRSFLFVNPKGYAFPCPYTEGSVPPVDLLADDWRRGLGAETPCTDCVVGPMVEFNLLFRSPMRSLVSAARTLS